MVELISAVELYHDIQLRSGYYHATLGPQFQLIPYWIDVSSSNIDFIVQPATQQGTFIFKYNLHRDFHTFGVAWGDLLDMNEWSFTERYTDNNDGDGDDDDDDDDNDIDGDSGDNGNDGGGDGDCGGGSVVDGDDDNARDYYVDYDDDAFPSYAPFY